MELQGSFQKGAIRDKLVNRESSHALLFNADEVYRG